MLSPESSRRLKLQAGKATRWPAIVPPVPPELTPRHIAIIMDGNGRWATRQGRIRINGHRAGAESVRTATRFCGQVGVQALTLYAFSTENWKRPKTEVNFLFRLLSEYLVSERAELLANNVRLTTIGKTGTLPEKVREELAVTEELTRANRGLNLCLALNYGAHGELQDATQALAEKARRAELRPEDLTPHQFDQALFTAAMPPLDLLIRTAGERRLSNFLLWQAAGAEFWVTPVCWPDFREEHLRAAIVEFAARRKTTEPISQK